MPKNEKIKKTPKKSVHKKSRKPAVKKKMAAVKAKPRKAKATAKLARARITHNDIEKQINEINIEDIIKKERDKRMILWAGVSFFMILIFAFWVFNLKRTFKKTESENTGGKYFEWSETANDFSKTMSEMKKNLAEIKRFADTAENYEAATSTVPIISTTTEKKIISTSTPAEQDDLDEIKELKARLEELENRLSAEE